MKVEPLAKPRSNRRWALFWLRGYVLGDEVGVFNLLAFLGVGGEHPRAEKSQPAVCRSVSFVGAGHLDGPHAQVVAEAQARRGGQYGV